MAESIKLPVIGNVKTSYVIAGGGAVLVIVGYAYYKHKQSAASTASPSASSASDTSTDPYPPDGTTGNPTDPNSTDPNTGETYGDEGEIGSASEDYGLGESLGGETDGYDPATGEYYDPADGQYDLPTPYEPGSATTATPETNPQWSQEVTAGLETLGYNSQTVALALGAFLNNLPLSSSEVALITVATAEYGFPPQGPNSIPAATTTTTPTPTPTPTPTAAKVTVPNVVGKRGEDAKDTIQKAGLVDQQVPATTPKGKTTTVTSTDPKAGTKVDKGSTVSVAVKVNS
jgi:hypothetical protein